MQRNAINARQDGSQAERERCAMSDRNSQHSPRGSITSNLAQANQERSGANADAANRNPALLDRLVLEILTTQRNLMEDPEVREAVNDLVAPLARAQTQTQEDYAWECFKDRIQYLITRAKTPIIPKSSCI